MKKLIKVVIAFVLLLGITTGFSINKAEAASQASYKLTAYNSKGKKVNVKASKNMIVTKVSGKNWYKGSLKYTSYKKVNGKWKKYTKTSTVYVPSKYVKKYTKTTSTVKPVTTTKWVKKTKTVKGWFYDEDYEEVKTGDIVKAGNEILVKGGNDYLWVQDKYGYDDFAVTLKDAVLTQDPSDSYLGYATVKYVDYDKEKVTEKKTVKTTKTTYKVSASTQAYTKIYEKNGITLSEYKKLKKGMTYKQVVNIIGENGKLEYSYDGYGTSVKSYTWYQKGVEYAEANIEFENNKLSSKWQYGLK